MERASDERGSGKKTGRQEKGERTTPARTKATAAAAAGPHAEPSEARTSKPTPAPAPKKPPRRTAAVSRERIVKAAIAEFAVKGLDGARVDEVARRSGVNKMQVYQYVGNKDRLFLAALEATYQTIRERQQAFLAQPLDPEAGIRELVRLLMSIWVEHPEWGKLLASENFHGGKHVRRSKVIGEMYRQLVETLDDLLSRGVASGVFRPGLDAVDLYISVSSLSAYFVSHQHTLTSIFDVDLMAPERLRQRERHIVEMVMRYVAADSGAPTTAAPGAAVSGVGTPRSRAGRKPPARAAKS